MLLIQSQSSLLPSALVSPAVCRTGHSCAGSRRVSDAVQADDPRGDLRHPPGGFLSLCLRVPGGGGEGGEGGEGREGERRREGARRMSAAPPFPPSGQGGPHGARGHANPLRPPPATLLPLPLRGQKGLEHSSMLTDPLRLCSLRAVLGFLSAACLPCHAGGGKEGRHLRCGAFLHPHGEDVRCQR